CCCTPLRLARRHSCCGLVGTVGGRPPPPPPGGGERLAEERFSEQERLRLGALEQMRQAEQR
ncbi:hypothetical protein, partial [Pseudomonas aeruginosa]|uniref:hypothetical protein n=1 Tax=Pseudomonas aeruginosa TaxID=287 RepID=UPI0021F0E81F